MPVLSNARQELFAQTWFKGEPVTSAAIVAGYAPKWAASIASRLSRNVNVLARYKELQQKAEDHSVATVQERKQVLTEIARGRFADFTANLTTEKLKSAALQEIKVTTSPGGKTTTIKLHNPIHAIAELNKMEGIYSDGPSVNVDNRTINITVASAEGESMTKRLIAGEGTEK